MVGKQILQGNEKLREKGLGTYLDHGVETGSVIKINREYIESLTIEMRLIDSVPSTTEISLFGKLLATPIMTGALSALTKICADPMVELAKGVAEAGSAVWVGIGNSDELQAIIDTNAPTIKIVKPYADNELIFSKLKDAAKRGAAAVGMDITFFFGGKHKDNLVRADLMGPKTLHQMSEFVKFTDLPFVIKGVLSVRDAVKAAEAGASAIVVSHHGGGTMDYAVPPLKILPQIKKELEGKILIFVDGGLIRGSDIFKALALGADGVLMGRVLMAALANGGAMGVTNMINGLNEEIRRIMSLTGCSNLKEIGPELIHTL